VWIEASGAQPALAMAVDRTRTGGRISVVGMFTQAPTANVNMIVRHELEIRGSYASVAADYLVAVDLLSQARIDVEPLLELFPLERALDALSAAAEARTLKPILIPGA
jgi:L-iditol 2-dehydrogenase